MRSPLLRRGVRAVVSHLLLEGSASSLKLLNLEGKRRKLGTVYFSEKNLCQVLLVAGFEGFEADCTND